MFCPIPDSHRETHKYYPSKHDVTPIKNCREIRSYFNNKDLPGAPNKPPVAGAGAPKAGAGCGAPNAGAVKSTMFVLRWYDTMKAKLDMNKL